MMTDYFFNTYNWSLLGMTAAILVMISYLMIVNSSITQKILFIAAIGLIYLVLGSPLADLTQYGLHSVSMLQHIILLMVSPVLILKSLPARVMKFGRDKNKFAFAKAKQNYLIFWIIAAIAMWAGHFLSAAIASSHTGTIICGLTVSKNSWVSTFPESNVYILLFFAGLLFALPVFHPVKKARLAPLQSVIYLFTACLSCSILGLYVTFSATGASMLEALPAYNSFKNPFPMSVRSDQELAGMLMWVPGCILYVLASSEILLQWYDETPADALLAIDDAAIQKKRL